MGVISRARNEKLNISIPDVLRAKSVVHLAELARVSPSAVATETHIETDEPFGVSPIQSLYLESAAQHSGNARFNQSFALAVSRHVTIDAIKQAMDMIVRRHSMLRATFFQKRDGSWEQRPTKVRVTFR
jgi:hypothetical protein